MLAPLLFSLAATANWVPARWPSGDPKTLDLVRGAAVNCLLLEAGDWNAAFVKAAAGRHIATLAVIHPSAAALAESHRAVELGFNGIVLEGDFESAASDLIRGTSGRLVVIELPSRGRMRLDSRDPIVGTSQALWPSIEIEHGGTVSTGPTSAPWINTNIGFLRFVTASTDAPVWIGERPPPRTVVPVERYEVAVADAAIAGAHWIVALDDDLESRLMAREKRAVAAWERINAYVRFFTERPEWRDYHPYGEFAVLEDTGSGGLLSSGLLDMLAVEHTTARALPTRRLSAASLHDARVVLNVDRDTLAEQQRADLEDFAKAGGKVVNPPAGWHFPQTDPGQIVPTRKQMDRIQPIWETTYYATVRKNFGARTFNTSSIIFDVRARSDGRGILVHLLNYTDFAAEDIALQVLGTWHRARLYTPDGPVKELPVYPVKDGTGVDISRITVLGTVVVD